MGTSGRRSPRRSSRRTFSSRSCRGCPTCRFAALSACQQSGSPSAPTPTSTRGRRRPCLASSTKITVGVSTICPGKVLPWSTLTSPSYVAVINISVSRSAALAFSFANARIFPILRNTVGIFVQIQDPDNVSNVARLRNLIMLSAILLLISGLCCLL